MTRSCFFASSYTSEEACHVERVQPGGYVSSQASNARGVRAASIIEAVHENANCDSLV